MTQSSHVKKTPRFAKVANEVQEASYIVTPISARYATFTQDCAERSWAVGSFQFKSVRKITLTVVEYIHGSKHGDAIRVLSSVAFREVEHSIIIDARWLAHS